MASTTVGHGAGASPTIEKTTEQLAAVYAAMMEELGIGRKNDLHLDNKGHGDFIVNPKALKKPATGLGAGWYNIEFDDVDPAEDELDPIADGQLYRLQRGTSNGLQQNFGDRGNRGNRGSHRGRGDHGGRGHHENRGGYKGRGGYVDHGGRWVRGGQAPRGGHATAERGGFHNNNAMGRPQPQLPLHTNTPQALFNDARNGVNRRAHVDGIIADLRAGEDAANRRSRRNNRALAPSPNHGLSQDRPVASVQVSIAQHPHRVQPPRQAKQSAASVWSLANSKDFLKHAGINPDIRGLLRSARSSSLVSQPVAVVDSTLNAPGLGATTSKVLSNEPEVNAPRSTTSFSVALDTSSRLLTPSPAAPEAHIVSEEKSPRPELNSQNATQSQQEIAKLFSGETGGGLSASIYADTPVPSQLIPAPEVAFQAGNENEDLLKGNNFKGLPASKWADESLLVKPSRLIKRENGVLIVTDNDSKLGQARLFKNTQQENFYAFELEVDDEILLQEVVDADVQFTLDQNRLTFQAGQSSPIWKVLFKMPYVAKNFYDTVRPSPIIPFCLPASSVVLDHQQVSGSGMTQPGMLPQSSSVMNDGKISDVLDPGERTSISEPAAASAVSDSRIVQSNEPNEVIMPGVTLQAGTNNFMELLLDLSPSSPGKEHQFDSNRLSPNVLSQMSDLEGLVFSDKGDEKDADKPLQQATRQSITSDDSDEIKEILFKLDSRPEGNFLEQLSAIVTQYGFPAAKGLTADELRNPPWANPYTMASQKVISEFISDSETFKNLPEFVSEVWVLDKSLKVLDLAITQRQVTQPQVAQRRVVFTIEELVSYRKNACEVRGRLIEEYPNSGKASPSVAHSVVLTPEAPNIVAPSAPLVTAPDNWRNFKPQQSDMEKWDAILNMDRKPTRSNVSGATATSMETMSTVITQRQGKATNNENGGPSVALGISDSLKVSMSANAPRNQGHVPTNSECDRLAQKFEGWHFGAGANEQQVLPSGGETPGEVDLTVSDTISVGIAPPRPLSSMSKVSNTASQSMTDRLTNALNMPLTISPSIRTPILTVKTRLQAIEGQLSPIEISEEDIRSSVSFKTRDLSQHDQTSVYHPVNTSFQPGTANRSEQSLLASDLKNGISDSGLSGAAASSLTVGCGPSVGQADHFLESERMKPTSTSIPVNAQFKMGGGLSSSRWATVNVSPVGENKTYGNSTLNAGTTPVFQPGNRSRCVATIPEPQQDPRQFGFVSQLAMFPTQPQMIPIHPGYVPLEATVFTRDPYTGQFRETRGMLKTGSVPVVAHMPAPPMGLHGQEENFAPYGQATSFPAPPMGTHRQQENFAPYGQATSFPARSDMYARRPSESSDSDANTKPGLARRTLSPLGRNNTPTKSRTALSPVGQGVKGIQAKLQSRLNSSLAGRQADNSPAHR